MKHLILTLIISGFLISSCRSHKQSAVAESSFVEMNSTAQVNEQLTNVSDTKLNSLISFDSIEIFIKRNWNSRYSDDDKFSPVWHGFSKPEFMANPDSIRLSSNSHKDIPYSEIIGIKAYNAKAAASSHSQDSLAASVDSSLAVDLSMEATKEESGSSHSVAVFDPPDVKTVVIFSFIFAAIILLIVYFIKRRS